MNVCQQKDYFAKCIGCGNCSLICGKKCITMSRYTNGFSYPVIDQSKCTNCGACTSVCPITNYASENSNRDFRSFAAEDTIRKQCSSGGAFYYLANYVIHCGGVVFGSVFDKNTKSVHHESNEANGLQPLLRSKYVQSDLGTTFIEIRDELNLGRKVLFCGAPCQVQALQLFLRKKFDSLYTIDFVCHGVPSPQLFEDYMSMIEKQEDSTIDDVTFREKDKGWRKQVTKIYLRNQKVLESDSLKFPLYRLFLDGITLRQSCYTCNMPESHASDLTLFDLWSSQKQNDDLGISGIKINTAQGEELINSIDALKNADKLEEGTVPDYYFVSHAKFRKNKLRAMLQPHFFRYYLKNGVHKTVDVLYPKYLKISKFIR